MGITHANLTVKAIRKSPEQKQVRFIVDSGVVYSLVPANNLKELGCEPYRKIEFSLTDGSLIKG